uniref:Uncharacterized protein n=1 Tax=Junco hyemalis TaxID=40217 RepID=A0A8C5J3B6_JUNHY
MPYHCPAPVGTPEQPGPIFGTGTELPAGWSCCHPCGGPQQHPPTPKARASRAPSCCPRHAKCNTSKPFHCSWPPLGPAGSTSYILNLCVEKHGQCRRFEAGTATSYILSRSQVYIFDNTTAWVEARWGNQVRRTPNHTLHLNGAVKLDPPTGMSFSESSGQLRVRVPQPQCDSLKQPPQHEARFWRVGDSGWTQVKCCLPGLAVADSTARSITAARGVWGLSDVTVPPQTQLCPICFPGFQLCLAMGSCCCP